MLPPADSLLETLPVHLRTWFGVRSVLSRKELLERISQLNSLLQRKTLDVYLHRLVLRNHLVHAGRGLYALPEQAVARAFTPQPPAELTTLWATVAADLFLPTGCVWTTQWLNDFTIHQVMRTVQLVEVEPTDLTSTYYALKERLGGRVFLQPDARVLELYVAETPGAVLVQPLVSRAPLQQAGSTPIPRLEKILVDLLSEPTLFAAYQGEELRTIYRNAARHYRIEAPTLLAYAKRRGKGPALRDLLLSADLSSLFTA